MQIVNIHQAKTQLSQLVARVVRGDEIIIGKAGSPVAKLIRYQQPKKLRKPGLLKGKISIPDDFTDEDKEINQLFFGIHKHQ